MLNLDESERLIRIAREQHMDYDGEYEAAYARVNIVNQYLKMGFIQVGS